MLFVQRRSRLQPQRAQRDNRKERKVNSTQLNELSSRIIGLAIRVHKTLGPGFVEKIYERALTEEFGKEKIRFRLQREIEVKYGEVNIGGQRLDIMIEDEIILELKAISELRGIHQAQMISYLKAANKRLGLILNFAKEKLEIKRIVNNF